MATKFEQTTYKRKDTGAQKINVASSTSVLSTVITDHIYTIRVCGNIPFWLTSGSSTVLASSTGANTSIYFPGDLVEYINIDRKSFISVIADGSSGFVSISEETQ